MNGTHSMLGKQAKTLSPNQIKAVLLHLASTRNPERNRVAFLLSVKAGLRAKEVASVTWAMVTTSEGRIAEVISLHDIASKGSSGGSIPMAREVQDALATLQAMSGSPKPSDPVFRSERSKASSAQVIVNLFSSWYAALGFDGCSSHSGRRTFITQAARNIGRFGGSLRDVQQLARHSSLAMTQRYIEVDTEAMRKVVEW